MKKSKGIISLILTVVLIALLGFTTVVGFGKGQTGAAKNIKLGLDLEGGVAQDLLDLPAIQACSDGMSVNFNPPLFVCGGVNKGSFYHDCSL